MESMESILRKKINNRSPLLQDSNVNVDKNIIKDVYDDNVASRIREAIDKPRAIGEILSEKLNAPGNIKLYIKLAHQHPIDFLFECLALTEEAGREGRIKKTKPQYFYGIVKMKMKKN